METIQSYSGYLLHQLGPYIGKMRAELARSLVMQYSKESDWVWDPFCGSGTVPLESQLLSRNVIASDINPYACVLTRAKLHAPRTIQSALEQLNLVVKEMEAVQINGMKDTAPDWISKFFHPNTLKEIIFLCSSFIPKKYYFHLGCLLGILHHQRPGFLSYPASHLVPYLRDKKFPREFFPELYEYRNPIERIELKINRMLRYPLPSPKMKFRILQRSAKQKYLPDNCIDAVITSPPYMDALDYSRDNRLRMWFLGVNDYKLIKNLEIFKISTFRQEMELVLKLISNCLKDDSACILVLGDLHHKKKYDIPQMVADLAEKKIKSFTLEKQIFDYVPDSRRSRKEGKATKRESIIVLRRKKRRF